jgi:hypothetical protein
LWALADLIEDRFWKTPTSATDDLYPYGVPYYLNMLDAAVTTAGFSGQTIRYQDGTTGTSCAGIDASTEAKWRNYADVYTAINNDFLKRCRKAWVYTGFKAPLFVTDPANSRNAMKRFYTGFDEVVELQDLADAKDDMHKGKELLGNIKMDGVLVYINSIPVVPIAELTGVTYDPIYYVDFSKFIPYVQSGYWMEETEAMNDRAQHTVFTVFLDGSHNNLCTSRRKAGFVLHTVTS